MKRSTSTEWGNLKVGAVLVAGIAAALWASLTGGGTSIFDAKSEFICYFVNVNGLVKGSPVWMSGVEIGNVRRVTFVNIDSLRQVEILCRVKSSVWDMISDNARVQLGSIGFLGDKYLELDPGPPGGEPIEDGAIVPTRDAGSAEAMFLEGERALGEAADMVGNFDDVLARMNRGEGTLGKLATDDKLYTDMTALLTRLTKLTAALQKTQERIVTSIEQTSNAVTGLADRVDSNSGTLGRLMSDPALYDHLASTSARLDSVMHKINTAEGTLGLFVSDTALYTETLDLMVRINILVTDIEANPKKYFKFSVF
jgi:phospholipid/cholesterol/gamma-HCH transport system substrate-binding protein